MFAVLSEWFIMLAGIGAAEVIGVQGLAVTWLFVVAVVLACGFILAAV
jgi:hypothetical protein